MCVGDVFVSCSIRPNDTARYGLPARPCWALVQRLPPFSAMQWATWKKKRGKKLNSLKDCSKHIFPLVEMFIYVEQHSQLQKLKFYNQFSRNVKVDTY